MTTGARCPAIEDLSHLRGGRLRELIIHAIDCDGEAYVAAVNAEAPVFYQYWNEDLRRAEPRAAEAVTCPFAD